MDSWPAWALQVGPRGSVPMHGLPTAWPRKAVIKGLKSADPFRGHQAWGMVWSPLLEARLSQENILWATPFLLQPVAQRSVKPQFCLPTVNEPPKSVCQLPMKPLIFLNSRQLSVSTTHCLCVRNRPRVQHMQSRRISTTVQ